MKTFIKHCGIVLSLCLYGVMTGCSSDNDQRVEDIVEPTPEVRDDSVQAKYLPMFKEGRVWNCMEVHDRENMDTIMYSYRVKGTDFIDGHSCYTSFKDDVCYK